MSAGQCWSASFSVAKFVGGAVGETATPRCGHSRAIKATAGANSPAANLKDGVDPAVFQGLNPSGTEAAFGYDIPNVLIDHAMHNPPIRPGFWRGVNTNQNAIYSECFMDECANRRRGADAV